MRRLRYLFLLLVTLGFAIGIAASLVSNNRTAELTTSRIQVSAWSLAQLEQEFTRFHTSLRLFQAGAASASQLQLDYELLWNRLNVFLTGEENRINRQRFDAHLLVEQLFKQLRNDEALLLAPLLQPGDAIEQRIKAYSAFKQPIRSLIILNFTGPEAVKIVNEAHAQRVLTQGLLLGLLFCGGALLLMLFLESRRNNFLARNDALTQLPNRQSLLASQPNSPKSLAYCALAVIEMNNFRAVNETVSHDAGDQLLCRIASALK